jgi:hypothetical protein
MNFVRNNGMFFLQKGGGMNNKICKCDIPSAVYDDMGTIKCQYCMGRVDDERAKKFIEYNTPKKEAPCE